MNHFAVSEKIIIMNMLLLSYPTEHIAYAFETTEDEITAIADYYHKGTMKAVTDAIHILIYDQHLSDAEIRTVFSSIGETESLEEAMREAHAPDYQEVPDTKGSEAYGEAFKAGYVYASMIMFHDLRIRTQSTIQEINALFRTAPDMGKWIRDYDHAWTRTQKRREEGGEEISFMEMLDNLEDTIGPVAVSRLKEHTVRAELNTKLRKLPAPVLNSILEWASNDMEQMVRQGMPEHEIALAMIRRLQEDGLLNADISPDRIVAEMENEKNKEQT